MGHSENLPRRVDAYYDAIKREREQYDAIEDRIADEAEFIARRRVTDVHYSGELMQRLTTDMTLPGAVPETFLDAIWAVIRNPALAQSLQDSVVEYFATDADVLAEARANVIGDAYDNWSGDY